MPHEPKFDLPQFLDWRPVPIYDPVPEWWIHTLAEELQSEWVAIRLDTMQQVLRVQADGLAKAADMLRSQKG